MERVQTIVARAVIIQRGKILLTNNINKNWYFLPGGHVEPGEFVLKALDRELREEICTGIKTAKFIGAHDNRFTDSYLGPDQEVGLIFAVTLRGQPKDRESHIATEWLPISRLPSVILQPKGLNRHIVNWLKQGRPIWMEKG